MALSNTSYLCGGTFFCLLLEARKTRANARQRQNGTTDGLSDQDVLKSLIYIVTGDQISTSGGTFKKNTAEYKSCKINGNTYIPFTEIVTISSFNESMQNKHSDLFSRMSEFVDTYISSDKFVWLTKALLETINNDSEINDEICFRVNDTVKIPKNKFDNIIHIDIQHFLLSILEFIINNKKENIKGSDTFHSWFSRENNKQPWKFTFANIGTSITQAITVTVADEPLGGTQDDKSTFTNSEHKDTTFSEPEYIEAEWIDEDTHSTDKTNATTIIEQHTNVAQNGENNVNLTNNGVININF